MERKHAKKVYERFCKQKDRSFHANQTPMRVSGLVMSWFVIIYQGAIIVSGLR